MNNLIKKINITLVIIALLLPFLPVSAADDIIITNMKAEVLSDGRAKISWNTDVNSTGKVEYGLGSWYLNAYVESNQSKRYHEVLLGNLLSDTKYYYQITAKNSAGQTVSFIQSFKTSVFKSVTAPYITNADVVYVAGTAAVVTWQTDEPASTYLEYGVYESYIKSIGGRGYTTDHVVIITGLKPSTKYSVRFNSTDKDGNRSSTHMREFTTINNTTIDKATLTINKFNPNSANDPGVYDKKITVKFQSNHWAKARVTISAPGKQTQSVQLDYETKHETEFTELSPATDYKITVRLDDIYGKAIEKEYMVKTKSTVINNTITNTTTNTITQNTTINTQTSNISVSGSGFYGKYYDLDKAADIVSNPADPFSSGWFLEENLALTQFESQLLFGCQAFPIPDTLTKGKGFAVHWSGEVYASAEGNYTFKVRSDDDAWIYIDGVMAINNGGIHKARWVEVAKNLSQGNHKIDVYFAERRDNYGCFDLVLPGTLSVTSGNKNTNTVTTNTSNSQNTTITNSNTNVGGGVVVLGSEYSRYTEASKLVKTKTSPDVYAVVNGMCHYISSPQSFNEYGYRWSDIKTISEEEFDACPRARLLKSPDRSTIYYLYQRPQDKWLKIELLSPTVFVSYPDNYWGNVITVNDFDINSYPNAKLIKTYGNNEIYFVEDNVKHFVSSQVFKAKGFNPYEVVSVSQAHFEGYKEGEALK
jgi:fibro-slime domain-containing protein